MRTTLQNHAAATSWFGDDLCSSRSSAALAKKQESEHRTTCNTKTHWIFGSLQPQLVPARPIRTYSAMASQHFLVDGYLDGDGVIR